MNELVCGFSLPGRCIIVTPTRDEYYVGQPVVYRLDELEKYWSVDEICGDGSLVLRTRKGKTHVAFSDDPQLRPATRWERFWHRKQFPQLIVP